MCARTEAAAQQLLRARHGEKQRIVAALAAELGVSQQTAYARLKEVLPPKGRKRRRDAGKSALTRNEALTIAAYIEETRRETAIGAAAVGEALQVLRANGKVLAGRIDETTGEFFPLSDSQVLRQMRAVPSIWKSAIVFSGGWTCGLAGTGSD